MNEEEAWRIQEAYQGKPHGWIQWKGTNVCMDVHCECGELTHIDCDFVYFVKCCKCNKKYFVNGHVQLIEISEEPKNIKITS